MTVHTLQPLAAELFPPLLEGAKQVVKEKKGVNVSDEQSERMFADCKHALILRIIHCLTVQQANSGPLDEKKLRSRVLEICQDTRNPLFNLVLQIGRGKGATLIQNIDASEKQVWNTEQFVAWLETDPEIGVTPLHVDLDVAKLKDLLSTSKQFELVPSTDGLVSEVIQGDDSIDNSRKTSRFDLHTDGAYLDNIPDYVVLHCIDPGYCDARTTFSNSADAIDSLEPSDRAMLTQMYNVFLARGGIEVVRPLLEKHPRTGKYISNLTNRGTVRPYCEPHEMKQLGVFDFAGPLHRFVQALEMGEQQEHSWQANQSVIFDNLLYAHGRKSGKGGPDLQRYLQRLWIRRKKQ